MVSIPAFIHIYLSLLVWRVHEYPVLFHSVVLLDILIIFFSTCLKSDAKMLFVIIINIIITTINSIIINPVCKCICIKYHLWVSVRA